MCGIVNFINDFEELLQPVSLLFGGQKGHGNLRMSRMISVYPLAAFVEQNPERSAVLQQRVRLRRKRVFIEKMRIRVEHDDAVIGLIGSEFVEIRDVIIGFGMTRPRALDHLFGYVDRVDRAAFREQIAVDHPRSATDVEHSPVARQAYVPKKRIQHGGIDSAALPPIFGKPVKKRFLLNDIFAVVSGVEITVAFANKAALLRKRHDRGNQQNLYDDRGPAGHEIAGKKDRPGILRARSAEIQQIRHAPADDSAQKHTANQRQKHVQLEFARLDDAEEYAGSRTVNEQLRHHIRQKSDGGHPREQAGHERADEPDQRAVHGSAKKPRDKDGQMHGREKIPAFRDRMKRHRQQDSHGKHDRGKTQSFRIMIHSLLFRSLLLRIFQARRSPLPSAPK